MGLSFTNVKPDTMFVTWRLEHCPDDPNGMYYQVRESYLREVIYYASRIEQAAQGMRNMMSELGRWSATPLVDSMMSSMANSGHLSGLVDFEVQVQKYIRKFGFAGRSPVREVDLLQLMNDVVGG
jgi:hypothetical protein